MRNQNNLRVAEIIEPSNKVTMDTFDMQYGESPTTIVVTPDKEFEYGNFTFYRNGWIGWNYDSTRLENYSMDLNIALAGITGGGTIALSFFLEEYVALMQPFGNVTPTKVEKLGILEDTLTTAFMPFGIYDTIGGIVFKGTMLLEQQNLETPTTPVRKTRWFKLCFNYKASTRDIRRNSSLNGFTFKSTDADEKFREQWASTIRLPFLSIYVSKLWNPLGETNFITNDNLPEISEEIINLVSEEILIEGSDINKNIIQLIDANLEATKTELEATKTELEATKTELEATKTELQNLTTRVIALENA